MKFRKYSFCILLFCLLFTSNIIYSKSQIIFSITTIFPSDDSYVTQTNPNLNYGNETFFRFGKEQITYLKFAFDINLDTLLKAKLLFYLKSDNDNNVEIYLSKSSTNWNENNITWDIRPTVDNPLFQFNISGNSLNDYEIEITEIITTNVLSICLYTESLSGYGLSKEYSNTSLTDDPKLTLTYEDKNVEVGPSIPNDISIMFVLLIGTVLVIIFFRISKKKIIVRY